MGLHSLPSSCSLACLLVSGHDRVRGEHAEQTGGGLLVLDIFHGRRFHRCPSVCEGKAAQDPAQARRPGLFR